MKPEPQFPAKVCERRCSTCVFGKNTPIGPERMRELAASWSNHNGHQICHHHGTSEDGEDVWCRGFWETQLEPELRAVFIAAGFVEFVPPDPVE